MSALYLRQGDAQSDNSYALPVVEPVVLTPEDEPWIRELCSHCHQLPSPDVLPRGAWKKTVWQMFQNSGHGRAVQWRVDPKGVVAWFEQRAPEQFVFADVDKRRENTDRSRFSREPFGIQGPTVNPVVANIQVGDVIGDNQPEVIVCDMYNSQVLLGAIGQADRQLVTVAEVPNPCHVELADLDNDNRTDMVVANLGSFVAMDHNLGSVEWLRQSATGTFERFTLADGLGRVADAEPKDFDGDGDLDILVAEFGWFATGHLILLENNTPENGSPAFKSHIMDGLNGASHVDVADLNGDGTDERIVLYSQNHEVVRCYSHQSMLAYTVHDLYRAPSPAWGFSGSQLIDFDLDGDLDILLSNGDTFDNSILKPYHGVQWLENLGNLKFEAHDVGTLYGVYRAAAADLDSDGDLDIAACTLVPPMLQDSAESDARPSLVWFEQTTAMEFVRHQLETGRHNHPTLALSDYDQDGDIDLLVGTGQLEMSVAPQSRGCIELWLNDTK
jgi:hypothetical protein